MNKTANWISKRMTPKEQEIISQAIDHDPYPETPGNTMRDFLGFDQMTGPEIDQYYEDAPMEMGMLGMGSVSKVGPKVLSMLTPEMQALRNRIAKANALEKVAEPQGKVIQVEDGNLQDIRDAQIDWKEQALDKLERDWRKIEDSHRFNYSMSPNERIEILKKRMEKAKEISDNFPDQGWYKNESWRVPDKIYQEQQKIAAEPLRLMRSEIKRALDDGRTFSKEQIKEFKRIYDEWFNSPYSDRDEYARSLGRSSFMESLRHVSPEEADIVPLETGLKEPVANRTYKPKDIAKGNLKIHRRKGE